MDKIQSISSNPLLNETIPVSYKASIPEKRDLKNAEDQVAALYYRDTQSSLASTKDQEKRTISITTENKAIEKSFLDRTKDWIWEIFSWGQKLIGWGQAEEVDSTESVANEVSLETESISSNKKIDSSGIPQLEQPATQTSKRLSQAIADINRELVNRLKDMSEFEKEMDQSPPNKIDKLIFLHLIQSSLAQRKIKETSSIIAQEELLNLHKKNQNLRKKHYDLIDAIADNEKKLGILNWVNIGLTIAGVGSAAIAFAFSGPFSIFGLGTPLSFLGRGSTMLSSGILNYSKDKETGELVLVKQETRANSSNQKDKLTHVQVTDEEITKLLKAIKYVLDMQTKATSFSSGR
jgi:hypothetical protein